MLKRDLAIGGVCVRPSASVRLSHAAVTVQFSPLGNAEALILDQISYHMSQGNTPCEGF